jgi:hypothetical protein
MTHPIRAFLAGQIRGLRGDPSQKDLGVRIGKPRCVVSRPENKDHGKVSLQTLRDIPLRRDIGLTVRFVDFPAFPRTASDVSNTAVVPSPYRSDAAGITGDAKPATVVSLPGKPVVRCP